MLAYFNFFHFLSLCFLLLVYSISKLNFSKLLPELSGILSGDFQLLLGPHGSAVGKIQSFLVEVSVLLKLFLSLIECKFSAAQTVCKLMELLLQMKDVGLLSCNLIISFRQLV